MMWKLLISFLILPDFTDSATNNEDSPCNICKKMTSNFEKGLADTASQEFEGGTSTWTKDRNITYEKSESRLITILEKICEDITRKDLCTEVLDKHEDLITNFFLETKENYKLFDILCVEGAKACCPPRHYGNNCEPCRNMVDDVLCNGHGDCDGDGTRLGTGECKCRRGFTGTDCQECTTGSYQNGSSCFPCDRSCNGTCVNGTQEGCQGTCNKGWVLGSDGKCEDIDECATKSANCTTHQYCVNVPGKFYCEECHDTCATCNGHSEKKCLSCKPGYGKTNEGTCDEIDECANGTHTCKPGKYCVNKPGGYSCKKCDKACKTTCKGPGPENCNDCDDGYFELSDVKGCQDIDECADYPNRCPDGKYCVNKKGSYKCKKCDESCLLCHGPDRYSCLSCADEYKMDDGICIHESKMPKNDNGEL